MRCDCPVCRSKDPRDNRMRCSVYVQTEDLCWIVDTGAEFRVQALRENISRVDAVVYTHSHADHIMGFDDLRRFSTVHKPIPVYASRDTMENLRRVFSYAFSSEARFPGYVNPEPHLIEGPFRFGNTEIFPIQVEHGTAHVFGFLFRQQGRSLAAYLSDCKSVSEDGLKLLHGVDTLIIGTPCRRAHPTHMSLAEGLELIADLQPRRAFITHLSHDFAHVETQKELPEDVYVAYDGLQLKWE